MLQKQKNNVVLTGKVKTNPVPSLLLEEGLETIESIATCREDNQAKKRVEYTFPEMVLWKCLAPSLTMWDEEIVQKIGVKPETTPGGRALKYYSTIRMSVRRGDSIKNGSDNVGHILRIKVIKNKIAVPYKEATVGLMYGQGIDRSDELFQVAMKADVLRRGGAWYSYVNEDGEVVQFRGEDMKFQGKDGMINAIRTIPEFFGELEDILRGVKVEADDMDEEEVEAMKRAESLEEDSKRKAGEKAYEKNKKALEKKLAEGK